MAGSVPIARIHSAPGHYEIQVCGEIDSHWTRWFDGLTVTENGDGTTLVACRFADQAALHGVLQRVRDLGMPLLSVIRIDDPAVVCTDRR